MFKYVTFVAPHLHVGWTWPCMISTSFVSHRLPVCVCVCVRACVPACVWAQLMALSVCVCLVHAFSCSINSRDLSHFKWPILPKWNLRKRLSTCRVYFQLCHRDLKPDAPNGRQQQEGAPAFLQKEHRFSPFRTGFWGLLLNHLQVHLSKVSLDFANIVINVNPLCIHALVNYQKRRTSSNLKRKWQNPSN